MTTNRRSIRYNCSAAGSLRHQGIQCPCRVENISENGTLIRLKDTPHEPIRPGDKCILSIYPDTGRREILLPTQVVHHGFTLIGLRFIENDREKQGNIKEIIQRIAIFS